MSGVVKINITEAPETLQSLLSQQKTVQGFERVQALYLLKTKQVETVQHLALMLGRPGSQFNAGYVNIVRRDLLVC